jgi:hypothetical protein
MEIKYIFSEKEKELINELSKMNNSFNYSSIYDAFRYKYEKEINEFKANGILYHSNSDSEGSWIRFSVSDKGLTAFAQAE